MSGDLDRRTVIAVAVALVLLIAIVVAAIALAGGGGGEEPSPKPPPAAVPSDDATTPGVATPPSAGGLQLPPGIAECLADQGVRIDSPAELHSVPPQLLSACFEALHQGGGAP